MKEYIKIKEFENSNFVDRINSLDSFEDRFMFFLKRGLPYLSIIMALEVFFVVGSLPTLFKSNTMMIGFIISQMEILFFYFIYTKGCFRLRYVFNFGLDKYLNQINKIYDDEKNELYNKIYNKLFFKKEKDNYKIKHLVDFINNDEYVIKDDKLYIKGDYHILNKDNLLEFGSLDNVNEINIFMEKADKYYLNVNKIEPFIDKIINEKNDNEKNNSLEKFVELENFRKNLNIEKVD